VIVGIRHERPHHPSLGFDQPANIGVAIVGEGGEVAAERRFRIVAQDRKVEMPVIVQNERPVVGDELGRQRDRQDCD